MTNEKTAENIAHAKAEQRQIPQIVQLEKQLFAASGQGGLKCVVQTRLKGSVHAS